MRWAPILLAIAALSGTLVFWIADGQLRETLYATFGHHVETATVVAGLDPAFIKLPVPAGMLAHIGEVDARRITASGATEGNADAESHNLESQRIGYFAVAGGIASDNPELIDAGLRAYEWAFAQMAEDGSFPSERLGDKIKYGHVHPLSFLLESAARSVLLVRSADVDAAFKARAENLIPKLHLAATHMNDKDNLADFYENGIDTNMLTTPATAFQEISVLTGDQELADTARWMVEKVLARQYADGTFPEKQKCDTPDQACYGFDTTYQTASLEYLARYVGLTEDPAWKATITTAIEHGTEKFLSKVADNGRIDTSTNSRTVACGERVLGTGPKDRVIDIVPLRLYYLGLLFGQLDEYGDIADRVHTYGQAFDHTPRCTDTVDIDDLE